MSTHLSVDTVHIGVGTGGADSQVLLTFTVPTPDKGLYVCGVAYMAHEDNAHCTAAVAALLKAVNEYVCVDAATGVSLPPMNPRAIYTDEGHAIINGLHASFPDADYSLCSCEYVCGECVLILVMT